MPDMWHSIDMEGLSILSVKSVSQQISQVICAGFFNLLTFIILCQCWQTKGMLLLASTDKSMLTGIQNMSESMPV